MCGGEISSNVGGVDVEGEGTFTMYAGEIVNNQNANGAGGVNLAGNSTFAIYGGKIAGNIGKEAGGVDYNGASMTVGGTAQIFDNKNNADKDCNVLIQKDKYLTLDAKTPLASGAVIFVTVNNGDTDNFFANTES